MARWCGTRPGRPARSEFAFHFADAAARVEEHARSVRVRSVAGEGGAGSSGRRADGAGPEGEPRSFWTDLKGTLKAWISCLTYHRALKRVMLLKKRDWESGDPEKAAYSVEADVKPEQWIRSLDFRRCLDSVFGTLQERQRRTMLLYFFEEQELSAIAVELQESLGNTRHHLYRGLAKLRRELVQKGLLQGYIEFVADRNEDKVPG